MVNADAPPVKRPLAVRIALGVAALIAAAPLLLWATFALRYSPAPDAVGLALAGGYLLANLIALAVLRPWRRAAAVCGLLFGLVVAAFFLVPASNERSWLEDVAVLPRATIEGDHVTIQGIRNFEYRSEFDWDAHWEERSYDLSKLATLDLSLTDWGAPGIVHTILSFGFGDGDYLAISIETRKEEGESYSAVRGFFRQYELYYVLADERDLLRLRTNYRKGEDVYLYRLDVQPATVRALFLDYVDTLNGLVDEPRWYNALTGNCTTGIQVHAKAVGSDAAWDWRILANGGLPELLRERGVLDSTVPLDELKQRSLINAAAQEADTDPDFSLRIRGE